MTKTKETLEKAIEKIKKRYPDYSQFEVIKKTEKNFHLAIGNPKGQISKYLKYTYYGDKVEDLITDGVKSFDEFVKALK